VRERESIDQKILVVDDDPSVGKVLARAIKKGGYRPLVCSHPQDALDLSRQENFVLAFIDINLPSMSGLELAVQLKQEDPLREVIFITGYGSFDNAVQAIKIGAYDYLRKPFDMNEFNLCLKRFEERQKLKEEIKKAEQRYYQLVQNIPLLIFVLNRNFQMEFVNETCSWMLGYSCEEATNLPNWLLGRIHPEDREKIKEQLESSLHSCLPISLECRLFHKDGHLVHVIMKSIPPSTGGQSEKECLEGFVVDISDRVFMEKALIQKEKLNTLGAISAEVAHEIRNPLTCIGGFARRLKKKFPDLRESEIIFEETQRLERILAKIKNYLKPVKIHRQQCSVNATLSYCTDLLSPEMERKEIRCLLDSGPGELMVYADPEILTQIFINLVRNAIESEEKGGALSIKTFETGQDIYIEFKNRTAGKRIDDPELLFAPFAEGGENIGLPLCYRLLKEMDGLLTFRQDKDFMVFTVSLPKTIQTLEPRAP
jgi:PAS domain S-box-containing protein